MKNWIRLFHNKELELLTEFCEINPKNNLSKKESNQRIEESLIEITYSEGQHKGNGILISENGLFLTAGHCIDKMLYNQKVRISNVGLYSLEKVCIKDEINDLILAKIKINQRYSIKRYNIHNSEEIEKMPIQLITRREGILNRKYGFILGDWNPYEDVNGNKYVDNFCINGILIPGDSGGVILSPCSELIGLAEGTNKIIGNGIKSKKMIDLILKYLKEF